MDGEKLIVSVNFLFEGDTAEMVRDAIEMGKQSALTQRLNRAFFDIEDDAEVGGRLLGISLTKFVSTEELERQADNG